MKAETENTNPKPYIVNTRDVFGNKELYTMYFLMVIPNNVVIPDNVFQNGYSKFLQPQLQEETTMFFI